MVANKRPAHHAAELVVLERPLSGAGQGFKEVAGVEGIVADEFVGRAMKVVRARLDDDIQDRPGVAPILRRALALHAELAQRIHREKRRRSIGHAALVERGLLAERVVIVDTVHQEDIGFLPLSVDAERAK